MTTEHRSGPHLGFLYPGHAAEDDYPEMVRRLTPPPVAQVVHTSVGVDAHRVDALLDLGSDARLLEAAERLHPPVDAVLWACTSGSFVFGWNGARRQVDALSRALGVPASSTSFAFMEAARAMGLARVAIAATYPDDVARAFADFLGHADVAVTSVGSNDIVTAAEVGTLGAERVGELVLSGDHPDAEAVLVPDTALHTVAGLGDLESAVGKPVLTANQVTMWEALRLTGTAAKADTLGALFRL